MSTAFASRYGAYATSTSVHTGIATAPPARCAKHSTLIVARVRARACSTAEPARSRARSSITSGGQSRRAIRAASSSRDARPSLVLERVHDAEANRAGRPAHAARGAHVGRKHHAPAAASPYVGCPHRSHRGAGKQRQLAPSMGRRSSRLAAPHRAVAEYATPRKKKVAAARSNVDHAAERIRRSARLCGSARGDRPPHHARSGARRTSARTRARPAPPASSIRRPRDAARACGADPRRVARR